MPPRLPIRAFARQFQAPLPQLRAAISTTTKNQAWRDLGGSASARDLLNMDESAPSSGTPNGTTATGTGRSAGEQLADIMGSTQAYTHLSENQKQVAERSANLTARENLASLSPRQWEKGDVYAPHDLSFAEALKWKKTKSVEKDRLDMLGLNPLDHYKNFSIVSEFMTDMGRIQHSKHTGLRPVNQRRMAKTIRRAIGMGIHPSTHRHPHVLFRGQKRGPRYQGKYSTIHQGNNKVKGV